MVVTVNFCWKGSNEENLHVWKTAVKGTEYPNLNLLLSVYWGKKKRNNNKKRIDVWFRFFPETILKIAELFPLTFHFEYR